MLTFIDQSSKSVRNGFTFKQRAFCQYL